MSVVAICNQALALLGARRITSLTDTQRNAGWCRDLYAPTRDSILEAHDWSFARKQESLPQLADAPTFGYDAAYKLPPDCLNVWWVGFSGDGMAPQALRWERVSNNVYADGGDDGGSVLIWYTSREADPSLFTAGFRDALATRLAAELCMALTESKQREQQLWQSYGRKIQEALSADGQQGRTRVTRATRLTSARGGGTPYFTTSGAVW